MTAIVAVVIAMALSPHLSQAHVLQKIAAGLRYVWSDPDIALPGASALAYRRKPLGSEPLKQLFKRCARPQAAPQTPGAFHFGLRMMAMDSTVENVADTQANAAYFGLCWLLGISVQTLPFMWIKRKRFG